MEETVRESGSTGSSCAAAVAPRAHRLRRRACTLARRLRVHRRDRGRRTTRARRTPRLSLVRGQQPSRARAALLGARVRELPDRSGAL